MLLIRDVQKTWPNGAFVPYDVLLVALKKVPALLAENRVLRELRYRLCRSDSGEAAATSPAAYHRSVRGALLSAVPMLIGAVLAVPLGTAPAWADEPDFVPTECGLPVIPPEVLQRLRCGVVEVPRLYDDPEAGMFKLAVTVVRSTLQPARPAPVVILPGGPGEATSGLLAAMAADLDLDPAPEEDLILIDPRGTGRSEPRVCGGASMISLLAADRSTDEMVAESRSAARACLAEARQAGISPESFGTAVTVEDLERIRTALGIEQWNAIGYSYGTVTGMDLASRHPQTLRSLILDSVALTGERAPFGLDERFTRAMRALISECAGSPPCARVYPDLPAELEQALERLNEAPLEIPMPTALALPGDRAILNRGDFEFLLFLALYRRAHAVPAMVRAVSEGRGEELAEAFAAAEDGATISLFTYLAVSCSDDGGSRFRSGQEAARAGFRILDPGAACAEWTQPGPAPQIPTATRVPTLILAGALDPTTPPAYGRTVAAIMGPAAIFTQLPSVGHVVSLQHPCAGALVDAFLADPSRPLDRSCATEIAPLDFE